MNAARYAAWRFVLPQDLGPGEELEVIGGLQVAPTGGMALVDEHASIRQSILMLLSTAPGERVMRPRYGCELHRLLFAPNDDTTAGLAIHYVRQAIARFEPRVEILRLDAGRELVPRGGPAAAAGARSSGSVLDVELDYRVRATRRTERLLFSINLAGEPG